MVKDVPADVTQDKALELLNKSVKGQYAAALRGSHGVSVFQEGNRGTAFKRRGRAANAWRHKFMILQRYCGVTIVPEFHCLFTPA